ncbi:Hypothetical predicted protein [Prunus dulcis]|uniref:Uncharacterized protein n=1 Tax=Prunus dulcis TaxID=3755 RepID=A0A5E4EAW8_PRUDU|nr:Hypothetical predicted protein [Prunus dulcis]
MVVPPKPGQRRQRLHWSKVAQKIFSSGLVDDLFSIGRIINVVDPVPHFHLNLREAKGGEEESQSSSVCSVAASPSTPAISALSIVREKVSVLPMEVHEFLHK